MLGISTPDYQFRSEQRLAAAPPTIFCVGCGKQITSNYIEKGGRPYCGDACAGPSTASTAKATFVSPSAESQQQRKAQEKEIYQNIQAGKSKCGGCGNVISDLSAVEYKGVMFHEYCFACSKCGQQIGSVVGFATTPSGPVCNRLHHLLLLLCVKSNDETRVTLKFSITHKRPHLCYSCAGNQGTSLCIKCKGKITGKYLNAPGGGGKIHPQCFVCASCKGDLSESSFSFSFLLLFFFSSSLLFSSLLFSSSSSSSSSSSLLFSSLP